jgi:hypothetical protein
MPLLVICVSHPDLAAEPCCLPILLFSASSVFNFPCNELWMMSFLNSWVLTPKTFSLTRCCWIHRESQRDTCMNSLDQPVCSLFLLILLSVDAQVSQCFSSVSPQSCSCSRSSQLAYDIYSKTKQSNTLHLFDKRRWSLCKTVGLFQSCANIFFWSD